MADIISLAAYGINAVEHIANTIQPGGKVKGDENKTQFHSGEEANRRKDQSTYGTWSTNGCVLVVVAMYIKGQQVATNKAGKINNEEKAPAYIGFQIFTENIECKHIKKEVAPIGMQKAGGNESFIISVGENSPYVKT